MNKSVLPGEPHFDIPLSPDLFRLVSLKDGWDGEGSKAVTKEALAALKAIKVRATRDGGVELEFTANSDVWILHVKPDGTTY